MSDARKAVLFDLDGVIVLTESVKAEAHVKTIERLGGKADIGLYMKLLGQAHAEVRAAFLEAARIEANPNEYSHIYRKIYNDLLDEKLKIRPGAFALIKELNRQGFASALVSSSAMSSVMKILRSIGLEEAFDVVIASEDAKEKKPDPQPYLLALKRLHVQPEHAVIFEDSPAGVEAAIRANVRVLVVRHAHNTGYEFRGAYAILDDFLDTEQIVALVRSILMP